MLTRKWHFIGQCKNAIDEPKHFKIKNPGNGGMMKSQKQCTCGIYESVLTFSYDKIVNYQY